LVPQNKLLPPPPPPSKKLYIETQDQMVITLSFNLSKEGVLKVYFEDLLITAKKRPTVLICFKWFQNQERRVLICKYDLIIRHIDNIFADYRYIRINY